MDIVNVLEKLTSAPGTPGAESLGAADAALELLKQYCPDAQVDALGNVTGTTGFSGAQSRILLEAHLDQIGFIVNCVCENGFLKVNSSGRCDARTLAAAEVTIHSGGGLFGVVTSTPPHLSDEEDRKKAKEAEDIYIDTGLTTSQARDMIHPGDRVTLRRAFTRLQGNRVSAAALDNRAGVAAVLGVLGILKEKGIEADIAVAFTVCEETGGQGSVTAAYLSQAKRAIAVDVSFAHAPGIDEYKCGKMGCGVMIGHAAALDGDMSAEMTRLAEKYGIPAQHEVMGRYTGTNADRLSVSRGGIKTSLLSVPLRNMHSAAEIVDTEDILSVSRLMAAYIAEREGKIL